METDSAAMSALTDPKPMMSMAALPRAARRRIWGWWAFDWASQPYFTLCLTFVFGPYFAAVATESFMNSGLTEQVADARAQSLWSPGQTVSGIVIALCAPILGAFADNTGRRMPWIVLFSIFYIVGAASLWFMLPDGSFLMGALIAFGIGLIGAEFTTIFTNSMLPELGDASAIGRLSGTGFAWGYAGGVLALFVMLIFFAEGEGGTTFVGFEPALGLDPEMREGTRFVGPFVALWYAVFMIPFFLWVREPRRPATHPNFGAAGAMTSALATWLGGRADSALGPKPVIVASIVTLIAVCALVLGMTRESLWGIALSEGSAVPDVTFYICGAIIGGAGGVLQSASRSMMVRHAPPARPTEAFGLYALSGKATAFIGPALIGLTTWITESARLGMLPLIALFALGLVLLFWVNPKGEGGPA